MATEKEKLADVIKSNLEDISSRDIDWLVARQDLGDAHFRSAENMLRTTQNSARELIQRPLLELPEASLREVRSVCEQLAKTIGECFNFNLTERRDAIRESQLLLTLLEKHVDEFHYRLMSPMAFWTMRHKDLDSLLSEARDYTAELRNTGGVAEKARTELDQILRDAKQTATEIGVAHYATRFENVAKAHRQTARYWMVAFGFLASCTIVIAFFWPKAIEYFQIKNVGGPIESIASRVIVLSILSLVVIWAGRNYRAHRHLDVVNLHRSEALTAFEAFVRSSRDDATKSAVLLAATRCIFSPSVTGYLGPDQDIATSNIVEIIGRAASGGSSK